jgi:hypothetical protein
MAHAHVAIVASSVPTARLRRVAGPRAVPLRGHKPLHRKDGTARQDVKHGAANLVREDRQGFPFAVFLLERAEEFLPAGRVAKEQDGGFRERPLQMDVAHLGAARPEQFAAGLFAPFHEPRVRGEFLHAIKARDVVDLVEDRQRQYLANARRRRASTT